MVKWHGPTEVPSCILCLGKFCRKVSKRLIDHQIFKYLVDVSSSVGDFNGDASSYFKNLAIEPSIYMFQYYIRQIISYLIQFHYLLKNEPRYEDTFSLLQSILN